jgi:CRP-like cAMP-binding protein
MAGNSIVRSHFGERRLNTTLIFFLANILYCLAYVVRDMKWLRIITIIAAVATLPYFIIRDEPLWSAVLWQGAFASINIVNLAWLLGERRPVPLTDEQRLLHALVFHALAPRQMLKLMDLGEWKDAAAGDVLVSRGDPPEKLLLLSRGQADVIIDGAVFAQLVQGRFVGEMGFMTGELASADVIAMDTVRYFCWKTSALTKLMADSAFFDRYLTAALSHDVVAKLRETGEFRGLATQAEDAY